MRWSLYDRHSKVSYAELRQSELEMTESILADMFGVQVDADHGATSTGELLQQARRKLQEQAETRTQQMRDQDLSRMMTNWMTWMTRSCMSW